MMKIHINGLLASFSKESYKNNYVQLQDLCERLHLSCVSAYSCAHATSKNAYKVMNLSESKHDADPITFNNVCANVYRIILIYWIYWICARTCVLNRANVSIH